MRLVLVIALLAPLALLAGGCESNECGPGSHQVAGGCVPSLAPTCGPGTELVDDICIPVEGQDIACGAMTHLEEGACVGDVDVPGNATRYTQLSLSKPNTVDDLVNPVVADALASGDMVFLTSALQPTDEELRLYAGPGLVDDVGFFDFTGEFSYETIATFNETGFVTAPFTWVIAGLTDDPIIVVDTVISEGEINVNNGVRLIQGGTLTGVITPENAMMVTLTTDLDMYTALVGLGIEADVDHDGDGTPESWAAIARFKAEPVWSFPVVAK